MNWDESWKQSGPVGGSSEDALAPPPPPPPSRRRPTRPRRRWLRRILWIGLFAVGLYVGLTVVAATILGPAETIEDGSWLQVRFSSSYPESRPDRTGLEGALGPTQLSATDLREALDAAGRDPRIRGVLVRSDGFPGSWAQVEELRRAFTRLQDQGKAVVAEVDLGSNRSYALASACGEVLMAPEGMLLTVGLEARLSFLGGSLEKLGAAADFVAVGEYKSAPEQLQRSEPSEASREQTRALLDDVWSWWLESIAADRGLDAVALGEIVDQAPLDAAKAVAEGVVDRVIDLGDWFEEQEIDPDRMLVDPLSYLQDLPKDDRPRRIGVVHVDGSIAAGSHGEDPVFGAIAGSDTVVERLRRARTDDAVAAVVLRVDSPGGSASASHSIYRELSRLREVKPVVVSMGGVAASGGYYVAMGADEILADSLTVTGSIGVFSGKFVLAGLYEKLGMSHTTMRTARGAGIFSDLEPFDADQRLRLRRQLEAFYERFVGRVAADRGLDLEAVRRSAGGRVWSGTRARDRGLVDALGGFDRAVERAEELAGLRPGSSRTFDYQPSPGLYERLLHDFFRARAGSRASLVDQWLGLVSLPQPRFLDGAVQYRLPWQWRIE